MLLHCLCLHPFAGRRGRRWDLASDMAVEQIIQREAVPRLALRPDPVRDACFRILGGEARSAQALYEMLEEGLFPFSLEEMEAAFRFDSHILWNRETEKNGGGPRKWRRLAAGAGPRGGRPGGGAASGSSSLCAMEHRQALSSDMNSGLLQKAATPASLASSSMSDRS